MFTGPVARSDPGAYADNNWRVSILKQFDRKKSLEAGSVIIHQVCVGTGKV